MPPTDAVGLGLFHEQAGFRYACFISWPTAGGDKVRTLVPKLKTAIEKEVVKYGIPPVVFTASDIPTGTDWERRMTNALCQSIALVAICGPKYYESQWCGREFGGMAILAERRLGREECAILPIIERVQRSETMVDLRQLDVLPGPLRKMQCLDISRLRLWRPNFEQEDEFHELVVLPLADRIAHIAIQFEERKASAKNCGRFVLPKKSAFHGFMKQAKQRYPMGAH